MILEKEPNSAAAMVFPPSGGQPHKVHTGENWDAVAAQCGMDVWDLIEFNFPVVRQAPSFDQKCRMVNWLLRTHVGCTQSTDGKNYAFDDSDTPGLVYLPQRKDQPESLANIKIHGEPIPAGVPRWVRWDRAAYRAAAKYQLTRLFRSGVGRAVINQINRTTHVRPLKHFREYLPTYVPSEQTVFYMPGKLVPSSRSYVPVGRFIIGATPDAALLHELVHAMRHAQGFYEQDKEPMGAIHYPPWAPKDKPTNHLFFGRRGEFNAIVITNIYISEINPGLMDPKRRDRILLVKDHHMGHAHIALVAPASFHKSAAIGHYLGALWKEQPALCHEIASCPAEFNPIRGYKELK